MTNLDPWRFFDRIYCISLKERSDRRDEARRQFASVGLLPRVEFVVVTPHPGNPEQGIFESHLACLRRGVKAGAQTVLIFEDDIQFPRFDPARLADACTALANLPDWNGFFLGAITSGSHRTSSPSLRRIRYRCLTHGYAVSRVFAEQLLAHPWTGTPYDGVLRQIQNNFFAVRPMCAFQGQAKSDNRTVIIDRLRRLCGGLPFIQRANELYQNHKLALIGLHLAALAGLCALAWW